MSEPENLKTDEVGTTNGEAVSITETVPETAQNEPKIAKSPIAESGQLPLIDPIVSVETFAGEAKPSEMVGGCNSASIAGGNA